MIFLIMAGAGDVGRADTINYRNLYTEITPSVVTEHTAWAKPYYRAALKSLWILPLPEEGSPRIAAEVNQRLMMDYTVCLVYGREALDSDTAKDNYVRQIPTTKKAVVLPDLEKKLSAAYDVIVIDDINWSTFPKEVRKNILEKVQQGTGLLFTRPQKGELDEELRLLVGKGAEIAEPLSAAFPVEALSCFRNVTPLVKTFQCGKGRVVVLGKVSAAPQDSGATGVVAQFADPILTNAEYYYSMMVRMLLWGAQHEPAATISEMQITTEPLAPYAGTLRILSVSNFDANRTLTAEIHCRDLRNRSIGISTQTITLSPGQSTIELHLANLKPVKQFVDLWFRDGDKTICWGSNYVEVKPEVAIQNMSLTRTSYEKDQRIVGSMSVAGTAVFNSVLTVGLWDNNDRLLGQQQLNLTGTKHALDFSFPASGISTPLAWLRYEVKQGEKLLSWGEQETAVHQRQPVDDFTLCVSSTPQGGLIGVHQFSMRRRELLKYGVQYGFLWCGQPAQLIRENQSLMSPSFGIWGDYGTKPQAVMGVRQPCLSDPVFIEKSHEHIRSVVKQYEVYAPSFYSLGGEFAMGGTKQGAPDICLSESCLSRYRTYVKNQYGTLSALNAEYGTRYQDWSEVRPALWAEAKASGNFASFVDHVQSMELVVADFFDDLAQTIHTLDSKSKVGMDSPVPLVLGAGLGKVGRQVTYNYPSFMKSFDGLVNYDFEAEREFIRSQAKPDFFYGEWWGGYLGQRTENFTRFYPWRMLFSGAKSSWYFHDMTASENALAYDLRPTDWFVWATEELQEIRSGTAKLILNATRQQECVAILWSQPCLLARDMEMPEKGPYPQNVMCSLMQDLGLSYRFITTYQLLASDLRKSGIRMLVLPWAVALTPEEAKQIQIFVARGGTVLADVRPGVMDAHCKVLPSGMMDDVFGVQARPLQRATTVMARKAKEGASDVVGKDGALNLSSGIDADTRVTGKALLPCYEAPFAPTTAMIQPDSPSGNPILVNQFGKGTTILLNLIIDQYGGTGWQLPGGLRNDGEEGPLRLPLAKLLAEHGIHPTVNLVLGSGPQAGIEIKCYRQNDLEYVALLANSTIRRHEQTATLRFPHAAYVYDVRKGLFFGKTDEISTQLSSGTVKLYALLPAKAVKFMVTAPEEVVQGQKVTCKLSLRSHGGTSGQHVFHMELIDPEGRNSTGFFRNLLAEDGTCTTKLEFALNEKPGHWLIKVKDIATGLVAQRELVVTVRNSK